MTVAPTLQKGLKRLFSSAVLEIVAAILVIIGLITTVIGLAAALATGGSTGSLIAAGVGPILILISGILVIIAAILSLVGIINVSKENNRFKTALYAVLIGLVVSIINSIVGQGNATVSAILKLVVDICNIVMFLFVCVGIRDVGEKIGRADFLGKYNAIVIFYALAALLSLVGGFMNPLTSIPYIFQILGSVCSIISFILYMGYLRKAIHAVDGVPVADQYQ